MSFKNKTIFITGASRGIGKAMALKLAAEGAQIVIGAKSVEEDPRLGGTIFSAAQEVEAAGGKGLAIQLDIRYEDQIQAAMEKAAAHFGGIDVVINNASAIQLTPTDKTESKRFDLMHDINVRGTFLMVKHALPFLRKGNNPHILTLSPPINLDPKWLAGHVAYTVSKYSMSMMALGWAAEFKADGIASNALWPRTTIDTAAVRNLLGGQALANMSRTPDIIADAAHYILSQPAAECTGNTFIDEEVLAKAGITDLEKYSVVPGATLYKDLFV
ncbi:MAG: NAD(P)-dependent oxidoreductase [Chitinophagaceae bacterium]|jgi:citronellol/citronellal dehydrogenase|nr:NAD(P)-dependent oxidoreductase [Chitinophagaceae bacterium]MCA6470229.1 NAD(P)-dependent oxidoreductase [Chitinophagaceae bacterium]MCA6472259.1 NAD(P)-dependent oxidoreductase [Chitinophagaceae bacterium]MCA6478535.1 NAD(P)-dependent oxidoreductase [Chitinophagaceae bacterium]MCA6479170.1 NAD(P)-dependent oxidoreductase [Chitinophagaceae bacterium]